MASSSTPPSRRAQGQASGRRATETLAEVAQSVEHRSEKPGVVSSILTLGTFFGSNESSEWEDPLEHGFSNSPTENRRKTKFGWSKIQLPWIGR